jgi:PadR family transcriptional regulator, regulatory protein PadR
MPKQRGSGELVQGTLEMLILRTLARGALHGYAIAVAIESRSEDVLRVEEGSLYPALHRMELAGMLTSEWRTSETNRRAKFYKLTADGRKQLAAQSTNWDRLVSAIARVMEA